MEVFLVIATFLGGWVTMLCLILTLLIRKNRKNHGLML